MDKKTFKFCICVLIAILIIPSVTYAASFDCSKTNTKTEKAICGDPMLSKLDDDLAIAYSKALKASGSDRTKKSQRKWLKETLAPCSDDKVCIKKAYENRLHQLGTGLVTARPLAADPGKIVSTTKPLKCAQCGVWQDADIGVFVVDDKRIIIPGCGVFDYKIEKYVSTPEPQRADRNTYKVSMLLKQQRTSFLCNNGDEKNWYLEANVSGHFQEGGTADFILRKTKSAEPSLELSGWSMDREDPCDAGSGGGTAACLAIEKSLVTIPCLDM